MDSYVPKAVRPRISHTNVVFSVFVFGCLFLLPLEAQRHEIKPQLPDAKPTVTLPKPAPPLYRDLSGMYTFLREGEFVQLTLEGNNLTGFVSRYGDSPSDQGVFLDQFFSKAVASGDKIAFVTRPIHGEWYEFSGRIRRGEAKDRNKEGFYLIEGELSEYFQDQERKTNGRKRQVVLKSFPEDMNAESAPKKH